ncbi:hypothetical protein EMIT053CA3_190083 [Pseudomonas donghuensis]
MAGQRRSAGSGAAGQAGAQGADLQHRAAQAQALSTPSRVKPAPTEGSDNLWEPDLPAMEGEAFP